MISTVHKNTFTIFYYLSKWISSIRESFEKYIDIKGFIEPYKAVFIRAPVIKKVWGNCEILAEINKKIVMARQDNMLALSFHPELTDDLRIHKYFLDMIKAFFIFKNLIRIRGTIIGHETDFYTK